MSDDSAPPALPPAGAGAGEPPDATPPDATPPDAGSPSGTLDAEPSDAEPSDAEGRNDAEPPEAGTPDAEPSDAEGRNDAAPPEAAPPEAGPPAGPPDDRADDDADAVSSAAIERGIQLVAGIIAPTTLLTALLYYFGFVATDSFYEYFGVDAATVQFSTQNYLLRSVGALYVPIGTILLLALLSVWVHPWLSSRLERDGSTRWARRAIRIALAAGALAVFYGVLSVSLPDDIPQSALGTPLILAFGIALLSYMGYVLGLGRRRTRAGATSRRVRMTRRDVATIGLVLALLVVTGFWAANSYAEAYGRGQAIDLGNHLDRRPAVVLDTHEELFLRMPGVTETSLPKSSPDQKFLFRYRGLRLLAQSGDRMFFVSNEWSPDTGQTLMLREDGTIRLQFTGS
ncbi:hypothetical protein SAMN05444157_1761 [Frankineae bacterium MT45]|nr:hypothetical protein SAMN05444157_1761 [Frankineae bacterium MT45]